MLKIGWLEVKRVANPDAWKSISMELRNAYLLCTEMYSTPIPLIVDIESLKKYWATDYDVILIGYGTYYAETLLERRFINSNPSARLIYITNDWECVVPQSLRESGRPLSIQAVFTRVCDVRDCKESTVSMLLTLGSNGRFRSFPGDLYGLAEWNDDDFSDLSLRGKRLLVLQL